MPVTPVMPAPLPAWAKFALRAAPWVTAAVESLFTSDGVTDDENDLAWMHVTVNWTRGTPTGTVEDAAIIGFDFVNVTSGDVDTTWNTDDFETVEEALIAALTSTAALQSNKFSATQIRWYIKRFSAIQTAGHKYDNTGPPVRITPIGIPGTITTVPLPYQVALSVTERTPVPQHWGRFYLPGFAATQSDAFGRLPTVTANGLAAAWGDAYADCAAAELFPVVPSVASKALLGVTSIQVDDIFDVIRSRRPRTTLSRSVFPAPS